MGRCDSCRFFVLVKGQATSRRMCVGSVKAYRSGAKVLNGEIDVMELILILGKEKLESLIGIGGENEDVCGEFDIKR